MKKQSYEVVVLMHPDATLEEQKDLFKKNKATIENYKGSIHSLETWGKRSLATPIGKLKKAVYFHSTFEADTQVVTELERTMRINDKVLRFMHTRLDERVSLPKFLKTSKKVFLSLRLVKKNVKQKSKLVKLHLLLQKQNAQSVVSSF